MADRQTVEARETQRAADFIRTMYPAGKVPEAFLEFVEGRKAELIAIALTPYRPDIPPAQYHALHSNWEAQVEGSEEGVIYNFFTDEHGTQLYKLHTEPVKDAHPVSSFTGWESISFRPWGWTWDLADKTLAERLTSRAPLE